MMPGPADSIGTLLRTQPVVCAGRQIPLHVRRDGIFVEIRRCDGKPLPRVLTETLTQPPLVYTHTEFLRGYQKVLAGTHIATEVRRLYDLKRADGRSAENDFDTAVSLHTSYGFWPRLFGRLSSIGYTPQDVVYEEVQMPVLGRQPGWDVPQWDRVADVEWRHRQRECLELICNSPCGIVNATTAAGKSFTIRQLTRLLPLARFDIVTKRSSVARGLYNDVLKSTPSVNLVGSYAGRYDPDCRVNVVSAASLHHATGDVEFVLGDEIHELAADHYAKKFMSRYCHQRIIGFSASIEGRRDGTDPRIEFMFGPVIFRLTSQEAVQHGMTTQVRVEWLDLAFNIDPTLGISDDTERVRRGMWMHETRNKAIADRARRIPADQQALILVRHVEHALFLQKLLPDWPIVHGPVTPVRRESLIACGAADPCWRPITLQQQAKMKEEFGSGQLKRAIATSIWDTGVDFPQLSVLIRASAGDSPIDEIQATGRPARRSDGKTEALVIDCWDAWSPDWLLRKSKSRWKKYDELGFIQSNNVQVRTHRRSERQIYKEGV